MKAQTLAVCAVIACAIQCFGTEEDSLPTYTGISGTGSAVVHIRGTCHAHARFAHPALLQLVGMWRLSVPSLPPIRLDQ